MKYKYVILLMFLCSSVSYAENIIDLVPKKTINELKNNKPGKAFVAAFGDSIKDLSEVKIATNKAEFADFVKRAGAPRTCELLISAQIIDRYQIVQYLCLTKLQPFTIQFDFYRYDKKWKVQGFSYNTNIDDILEEAIKVEIENLSSVK